MDSARENLTATLNPLLELIARYTGTCVSLFVGAPPTPGNKNFFLKAINCGVSTETKQRWSDYQQSGFQLALREFSAFVVKTDRESLFHAAWS